MPVVSNWYSPQERQQKGVEDNGMASQEEYRRGQHSGGASSGGTLHGMGLQGFAAGTQQFKGSGSSKTRPSTSRIGSAGQRAPSAQAALYRSASSRSASPGIAAHRTSSLSNPDSNGRPATASAMPSSKQQLAAYQVNRPPTSGGMGMATDMSLAARYSPFQAYGSTKLGSPQPARGARPNAARTGSSVDTLRAAHDHDSSPGPRPAWHDSLQPQPYHQPYGSPSHTSRSASASEQSTGGPGPPSGLPPQSPTRPASSSFRLLPRSSSARHDQHSSLLASLMVQQVGVGDFSIGSPSHTAARVLTYSPAGDSKTRKSARGTRAAGTMSPSSRAAGPYAARPGTGNPGQGRGGGGGHHALPADHPLQRRFSTGSVAGQQWAEQVPAVPVVGPEGWGVPAQGTSREAGTHRMQEGTLTCVRPSTTNASNFALAFAAESQPDVSSAATDWPTQGSPHHSTPRQHDWPHTARPTSQSHSRPTTASPQYPPSPTKSVRPNPAGSHGTAASSAAIPASAQTAGGAGVSAHAHASQGIHSLGSNGSATSSGHAGPAEPPASVCGPSSSHRHTPGTGTEAAGSSSQIPEQAWASSGMGSSAGDVVPQTSNSLGDSGSHSQGHDEPGRLGKSKLSHTTGPQQPAAATPVPSTAARRPAGAAAASQGHTAAAAWAAAGQADTARPTTPSSASRPNQPHQAPQQPEHVSSSQQQPQQPAQKTWGTWVQPADGPHTHKQGSTNPASSSPRQDPTSPSTRPASTAHHNHHQQQPGTTASSQPQPVTASPAKAAPAASSQQGYRPGSPGPGTGHVAATAAVSDTKGGSGDQKQGLDKTSDSSTNPLHMFAGLASKKVTIHPPRLPNAVDENTLLSGHINAEHTAALPGYAVGKVIGEGGFCQVRLAVHRLSGRRVAVKVIDKMKLADAAEARRIQREIRVMRHLSHECVVKLFEVVDAPTILYLVMEHAPCGSLLDYVRGRKRLAEADAVTVVQQIVAGLAYCHQREVVHRDIKLENILLDANNCMKLIDFGLSAFFIPGKQLRVHCGSPSYAAPEIVARNHYDGPPVDVWSLGVVLFAMLAGHLPFHASGGNKQELCAKIMEGKYTCPDHVSPNARDLLAKMLCVDPTKRITLDQITIHPWLTTGASQWEALGASVYMVRVDPSAGLVYADEQLVMELEAAGYSRQTILQYLLNGDANYLTAGYFLMCEGKAEVIRRMRGAAAARRYIARAVVPNTGTTSAAPEHAAAGLPLTPTPTHAPGSLTTTLSGSHKQPMISGMMDKVLAHAADKTTSHAATFRLSATAAT